MQESEIAQSDTAPKVDFGVAIRAPFHDPEWKTKLALLALLQFLPITPIAVIGWDLAYQRAVATEGQAVRLPGWGDFVEYLKGGIKVVVAAVLWLLLTIMLFTASVVFAMIVSIFVPALRLDDPSRSEVFVAIPMVLWGIGMLILFPAMYTSFAVTGDWHELFGPRQAWRRIKGHGSYWKAFALTWAISLVAAMPTLAIEELLPAFTAGPVDIGLDMPVSAMLGAFVTPVTAALFGQWAASAFTAEERAGASAEVADLPETSAEPRLPETPSWEPFVTGDHDQSVEQEKRP